MCNIYKSHDTERVKRERRKKRFKGRKMWDGILYPIYIFNAPTVPDFGVFGVKITEHGSGYGCSKGWESITDGSSVWTS